MTLIIIRVDGTSDVFKINNYSSFSFMTNAPLLYFKDAAERDNYVNVNHIYRMEVS